MCESTGQTTKSYKNNYTFTKFQKLWLYFSESEN